MLFTDSNKGTVNQVTYTFESISGDDGKMIKQLENQKAPDGTAIQKVKFTEPGPIDIKVTIDSAGGTPTGEFVESATFKMMVV
jgi:hypothetical protein